jgi:hypothetical protein
MTPEDYIRQAQAQQKAFKELEAKAPVELYRLIRAVEPAFLDVSEWAETNRPLYSASWPRQAREVWMTVGMALAALVIARVVFDDSIQSLLAAAIVLAATARVVGQWATLVDSHVHELASFTTQLWRRGHLATFDIVTDFKTSSEALDSAADAGA